MQSELGAVVEGDRSTQPGVDRFEDGFQAFDDMSGGLGLLAHDRFGGYIVGGPIV